MGDGVGVAGSGVGAGGKSGRVIKEEQLFNELGYLVPPDPYNEFERRRALYKSVAVFFFFLVSSFFLLVRILILKVDTEM